MFAILRFLPAWVLQPVKTDDKWESIKRSNPLQGPLVVLFSCCLSEDVTSLALFLKPLSLSSLLTGFFLFVFNVRSYNFKKFKFFCSCLFKSPTFPVWPFSNIYVAFNCFSVGFSEGSEICIEVLDVGPVPWYGCRYGYSVSFSGGVHFTNRESKDDKTRENSYGSRASSRSYGSHYDFINFNSVHLQ